MSKGQYTVKATATKPVSVTLNGKLKTVTATVTMPVSVTCSGYVKNNPPYSPLTKGGHRGVGLGRNGPSNRSRLLLYVLCCLLYALSSKLMDVYGCLMWHSYCFIRIRSILWKGKGRETLKPLREEPEKKSLTL